MNMKQSFRHFLGSLLMLALPLLLTSCEGMFDDILGEWSRPGSKEAILSNLSSALEEGALVTITYTIDGVEYTSTFKKVGGKYIEQTPAFTRSLHNDNTATLKVTKRPGTLEDVGGSPDLNIVVINNDAIKLDGTIDGETCELTMNLASEGSELKAVSVDSKKVKVVNEETEAIYVVKPTTLDGNKKLAKITLKKDKSWEKTVDLKKVKGGKYLDVDNTNDQVIFSANDCSGHLEYEDGTAVKPSDIVGKKGAVYKLHPFPTVPYYNRSWNATTLQVVTHSNLTADFNIVTSSEGNVTWNKGTYVVNQDVTIDGDIDCYGDINLILCDGCTLTVKGCLWGYNDSFTIYDQPIVTGAGKLRLSSYNDGFNCFSDLVIHGGDIKADTWLCSEDFNFTMYGGKFFLSSKGQYYPALKTGKGNNMTIYGGEVEVSSVYKDAIVVGGGSDKTAGTLTVYGGKVTAKAPNGRAIVGKFKAGAGCNIEFRVSEDGSNWGDQLISDTVNDKFFKAEKATNE